MVRIHPIFGFNSPFKYLKFHFVPLSIEFDIRIVLTGQVEVEISTQLTLTATDSFPVSRSEKFKLLVLIKYCDLTVRSSIKKVHFVSI